MSGMPRRKASSKKRQIVQMRRVPGDGPAPAGTPDRVPPGPRPAAAPGKRAQYVQQKEAYIKAPLKLPRNKEEVVVPAVEYILRLSWAAQGRQYEIYPMTPMEMHKKRKRDRVLGMPLYYSLMAADHKIIVYPIPNTDIKATIEYKPL